MDADLLVAACNIHKSVNKTIINKNQTPCAYLSPWDATQQIQLLSFHAFYSYNSSTPVESLMTL